MEPTRTKAELEYELAELRAQVAELERAAPDSPSNGAELERQTRFLYRVLESLNHPFYVIDAADYSVRLANRAAKFGDLSGKPTCHALTHGRDEPCGGAEHACPLDIVKATGKPVVVEHVHYDPDGKPRNIEVHAHPIFDEAGTVTQMIEYCLDITERRHAEQERQRLEARLRQTHKMEAIGTLAGGVAHDMNNMLAAIMGSASLLTRDDLSDESRRRLIERILDAAGKGSALTQNLLGFARKGTFSKERLSLRSIIEQVGELLSRTVPKQVTIDTEIEPELAFVEGDANQLSQVLMNLGLNAIQALGGAGTVKVTARNVTLQVAESAAHPGLSPGPYVELKVIDQGAGMDEDTLEHAIEPFFTTKAPGQGTGLGLSMAYGTVHSHGGAVHLASELGRGTTVTVLLPAVAAGARVAPQRADAASVQMSAGGTILLVDDEELVRSITHDLLESLGYEVVTAEGGAAALEAYGRHRDRIQLVLLDMCMPVMDGPACFKRLRALDPTLRVLLCSGFAQGEAVDELLARGAVGFLAKPFRLRQLAEAVAEALSVEKRAGARGVVNR